MDSITVTDLVKHYGDYIAVNRITFAVPKGEIFGFLGPNGAGKTTTINVLCTLIKPTAGAATVNGYDVLTQRSEVRRSIGLVFQEPTLDDYLTAEQNLLFHAYAYGVPRAVREERMQELLTLVELWDKRKQKIRAYSGGMRRRLELVRGLLHHPDVLFLDEPTLGLDPQTRRRIWDYILDLREREQLTIFLTTHYMDEAEHCERIGIIDNGEIVALDTPNRLKDGVGGDLITLKTEDNAAAERELNEQYQVTPRIEDGTVQLTVPRGDEFLPNLLRSFSQRIVSIGLRRPTLDDVFLKLTGHTIRNDEPSTRQQMIETVARRWGGR